jgi:hypothetical protein
MAMNALETTSLPNGDEWFAELPAPEVSDTDFDEAALQS